MPTPVIRALHSAEPTNKQSVVRGPQVFSPCSDCTLGDRCAAGLIQLQNAIDRGQADRADVPPGLCD